jgi:small subunit ribosomal protein S1
MSDSEKHQESHTYPPEEHAPPADNQGKVPSLDAHTSYGGGKRRGEMDDEIERQLQEAMGGGNFDQMLAAPAPRKRTAAPGETPGKIIGKVHSVHKQDVFIDVPGGRSQGVLPLMQFPDGPPSPGDEVEVTIEGADHGMLILSRKGAAQHADWSSVQVGMIVEARVTATNKGGVSVEVNQIRGFMPISQLDLYRVENAEQFVNQKLRCVVTEVDPHEKNLVLSRRALLEKERDEQREKVWATLAEGQIREGVVRSIRDFGAFVDIGGVDGLLPISQLSWSRVDKVEDVLSVGQGVRVVVLKADPVTRKVSLGLKQLAASPWDNIRQNYPVGTVVNGKVTRLAEFGAFVELEPGVEGLIHISELSLSRIHRVKDAVQVGQDVQVKVMAVDPEARRIGLSLKATLAQPEVETEEEEEDYTPPPPRPANPNLRGGTGGPGINWTGE